MNRWTLVALGTLLVIAFGAFQWRIEHPVTGGSELLTVDADGSATAPAASASSAAAKGSASAGAAAGADAGPPTGAGQYVGGRFGAVDEDAGLGADGGMAAFLPTGTPKSVRFGVVVVRYRGVEGQPPSDRAKSDAAVMARALAEAARTDFRGAVSRGDQGSMEDAGRMPRGVLEAPVEYALFTMKPGEVSNPIDTARGFWILRRGE